ncbi:MAG: phage baseplate assembly protein V [Patescibacteria group bacterium]|nr:phage baseplate assembly protein V [Patescibacteria group bacterium]
MKQRKPIYQGHTYCPLQYGKEKSVDVSNGTCIVVFPSLGNLESMPLQFGGRRTNANKDWEPPEVGAAVACLMDDRYEHGVVICEIYSTKNLPPSGATATQWSKTFSDGTVLKYDTATKALTASVATGGTVTITASGDITLNNVVIDSGGNINLPAGKDVTIGSGGTKINLSAHTHQYVPGTGTPTQTNAPTAGT